MSIKKNIESLLSVNQDFSEFHVAIDNNCCNIIVVGDCFLSLKKVKQQQLVYSCISSAITSGDIHAVSIKTFSKEEWRLYNELNLG